MLLSRSLSRFASIALVATVALAGCATTGSLADGDEEVASGSEATSEAAPAGPHGRGGRFGAHGGPGLIAVALHELDLSDAQRKTLEDARPERGEKDFGGMKAFNKALAEGVRAGKLDEAAVKAKLGELDQQASARRASEVKALEVLHTTLTPEQRTALVAKVEEHADKRGHGPKFDGKERGARGPSADAPEGERGPRGPEKMGRGPRGGHGPMGFLLHGIELRDEQRTAIEAALAATRPAKPKEEEMAKKHEEMRSRRKAALESFRGDTFNAAALLPEKPAGMSPGDHVVKELQAILPVLDEGQRAELAKRLEEGPQKPHFEGRGHHGKRGEARPEQ
jgi:Spy/CpxP family protein refolding chaperone